MTAKTKVSLITLLLIFAIAYSPVPVNASGSSFSPLEFPGLPTVTNGSITENGQAVVLRELQVVDLISFPVIQQPPGNVTFVSSLPNYVTEFQMTSRFGTIGLLAHNYLAGQHFSQILLDQQIRLVYSDQSIERFVVTEIQQYQALDPDSPISDFIDLATGEQLTASQVFKRTYGNQPGRLILQTCIFANNDPSWGRLFIIAKSADQISAEE